jgi:hypothetical protein
MHLPLNGSAFSCRRRPTAEAGTPEDVAWYHDSRRLSVSLAAATAWVASLAATKWLRDRPSGDLLEGSRSWDERARHAYQHDRDHQ